LPSRPFSADPAGVDQIKGVLRWVVVEADDVDDFVHEQRVAGQLEPVLEEPVKLSV
jgi:hypothetical protein